MSSAFLALRNVVSNQSQINTAALTLNSTAVALGQNASSTKVNYSNGSYSTWQTPTLTSQASTKSVKMSSTGQYQLVVTSSTVYLSADSGATWATVAGLPTGISWLNGSVSGSGQYMTLTEINGVWLSSDYGVTFAMTKAGNPNIWLKFENSVTDTIGTVTPTVTGSPAYVAGPTKGSGSYAINLVNAVTLSATASQYIQGSYSPGTNYTVSGWFNMQSVPASTSQSIIFGMGANTGVTFQICYVNSVSNPGFYVQFLNSSPTWITVGYGGNISTNTWYHFVVTMQQSGTCSAYLNGNLIGTVAGSTFNTTITTYSIGTNTPGVTANFPFSGYLDDIKIYNTSAPVNYLQSVVSGSGQYVIASAQSGHLTTSSNYGAAWSNQGQLAGSGQLSITPNKNGLSGNTWTTNGINWTVSASSNYTGCDPFYPFSGFTVFGYWATLSAQYTPSGNSSGINTTFYTNGSTTATIQGDWLQLTSSVPLIMSSYQFGVSNPNNTPKTYYILGSNDGTTWYAIQYASATSQPGSTNFVMLAGTIVVNSNSTQTWGPTTLTTTTYTGTTNAYTYFRFLVTSVFYSSSTIAQIGTWIPSFIPSPALTGTANTAGGALAISHSGQYALTTAGNAAGSVMPNMTGLTTTTWVHGGVTWTTSASTSYSSSFGPTEAFNNLCNSTGWGSAATYVQASGLYTTSNPVTTTIQGGVGAQTGEWVQIQSNVPLVLYSYSFGSGGNATQVPRSYYIVGSMDGIVWYPLHSANFTTNPFSAISTAPSSYMLINYTGTQSLTGNTTQNASTIAYASSTNAYTYFRMIVSTVYGSNNGSAQIGDLYLNFQPVAVVSTNSGTSWTGLPSSMITDNALAISGSGQYVMGTSNVIPFARLTLDNTAVDSQGGLTVATGLGTVSYNSSTVKVGTYSAWFNHSAGQTPSVYLRYTVPTLIYMPTILTVSLWIYPTANPTSGLSIPFAFSDGTSSSNQFYINSSGALKYSWYTTVGSGGDIGTTNITLNTWSHLAITFNAGTFTFYVNGVVSASVTSTGNMCVYGNVNMTNIFIGSNTPGYNAFAGYVDDVRIYTSALSASQIAGLYNNPSLASQSVSITNNYLASSAITTNPTFPSINAPLVAAATSFNGQNMVAVTSGTTNNVYYSTNYGVTWTNITLGSAPMVGCTMSYDGSYLTATSATATYTLNTNSTGYQLAIGNQAGQYNQAANAIAIGNQAGLRNQSANSIVLNATGSAVTASQSGFYVAPIQNIYNTSSGSLMLLGYGDDKQIVQTGIGLSMNGNILTTTKSITTANYTWMNWNSNIFNVPWPAGTMYYKIATLGSINDSVNHGAVTIKGTLGGWVNATNPLMYVDIVFSTRGAVTVNGTVQSSSIPNAQNYMDLQYIVNSAGQYDVYLAVKGGYVSFDIMVGGNMGSVNSVLIYDPSMSTYTSVIPGTMTSLTSLCQMYVSGPMVGIGTSSPPAALTIYKSDVAYHRLTSFYINTPQAGIVLDSTQSASGRKWNLFANTSGSSCTDGSLALLDLTGSGAYRLVIDPSGNVGIGITNPSYTLHVAGTIYATGDITAFSDQRYKTRIAPIETPLTSVAKLQGVSYYRTDEEPDRKRIGFLAQQVKEVYPEAVNYDAANDKYSVSYISLVAPLVEAVKELKEKYDALAVKHEALSSWATANGYTI